MYRISIVVPMRNAERTVAQTLRSILAQDVLEHGRDEIVVIDDGSTDTSRSIVEGISREDNLRCMVRVIDGPRQGISAGMNLALAEARGEWICRCDSDDLYPSGRLARQLRWLEAHPDFAAVCGNFSTITASGRPIREMACGDTEQEITAELLAAVTRTHLCTFLARAEALRKAGGFRSWFVTAEDVDLQLRLGEVCRVGYEPAVAYIYRLHGASITHQQPSAIGEFYEKAAREFAAQRKETGVDALQRGMPPAVPAGGARNSVNRHVQKLLIGTSWKQHREGRRIRSIMTGLRACMMGPGNAGAWKNLAALALKRASSGAKAKAMENEDLESAKQIRLTNER